MITMKKKFNLLIKANTEIIALILVFKFLKLIIIQPYNNKLQIILPLIKKI